MLFRFKNLGIIESADIEVKGLTVITGLNDTGKSFLGRAIFSIIKTNKEASREIRDLKFKPLRQGFQFIQSVENFSGTGMNIDSLNKIQPLVNFIDLYLAIEKNIANSITIDIDNIESELKRYKERIENIFDANKSPITIQHRGSQLKLFNEQVSNIIITLKQIKKGELEGPNKDYLEFYNTVIIPQLFKNQINSVTNPESTLTIETLDEAIPNISIKVQDNICTEFGNTINSTFNDSTYIESPAVLQLLQFIVNGLAFGSNIMSASSQRIGGLPYHIYDLVNKISNNTIAPLVTDKDFTNSITEIRNIIGGRLFYDPVNRSIAYDKNNGVNIMDTNIASGIKGLGILDILFSKNIINDKTLLIIDEPEVHLHPSWEVKYAEVIVKLSKSGVPIIINSHSPYLLQALTKYVKEYDTKDITNFYFGKKNSVTGSSIFTNVTENLEPIFQALANPMQELL